MMVVLQQVNLAIIPIPAMYVRLVIAHRLLAVGYHS